jgi:hypothetical protein
MYLFVYSGFQYISCCVFCFVCLRRVYPMFPVSLDCPFVIIPSLFSRKPMGQPGMDKPEILATLGGGGGGGA